MKFNIKAFAVAVTAFTVAGLTITGNIGNIFADALNEMVFFLLASMMGFGSVVASFEKKVSE